MSSENSSPSTDSRRDYPTQRRELARRQRLTKGLAWVLGLVGAGAAVWLVMDVGTMKPADLGTAVGGITGSLWALTGLVVVYLAFLGQQVELTYQQEELEEQRKQLAAQTGQFRRQQDESTFFNMLGRLDGMVSSLGARHSKGRTAFHLFYGWLKDAYNKDAKHQERAEHEKLQGITEKFFRQYQVQLGPYLHLLELLLRFIETSTALDDRDKVLYSSLIAGQLSREEALLIAYFTFTVDPEVRKLFERWGLFRYFPNLPFLHEDHGQWFRRSIFKAPSNVAAYAPASTRHAPGLDQNGSIGSGHGG